MENIDKKLFTISEIDFSKLIKNILEVDLINEAEYLKIQNNWLEIVGPFYFDYSHPLKIEKKILYVLVLNPAIKMEILFLKDVILKNLNKYKLQTEFKKLNFVFGKIPIRKNKLEKKKENLEGKSELLGLVSKIEDKSFQKKMFELLKVI